MLGLLPCRDEVLGFSTSRSKDVEEKVRVVMKAEMTSTEGKEGVNIEACVVDETCQIHDENL